MVMANNGFVPDMPIQDLEGKPVYGETILNWLRERVENYTKTK